MKEKTQSKYDGSEAIQSGQELHFGLKTCFGEKRTVRHYSQRRTLTGWLEYKIYCTTTMDLSKNFGGLIPLKNVTETTLNIGA